MLTISELLVLQAIIKQAESLGINKTKVASDSEVSRTKVHRVFNKYRELKINVRK